MQDQGCGAKWAVMLNNSGSFHQLCLATDNKRESNPSPNLMFRNNPNSIESFSPVVLALPD